MKTKTLRFLLLSVLIFSLMTPSTRAQAAGFVVTKAADTADGTCDVDCSLREAIIAANAAVGADTITFSFSGTITLGSTLPIITDAAGLTMDGTGQTVTISGSNLYRVLIVDNGASLTLNNLTIANGYSGGAGGGVVNFFGMLTITNSTFSGNSVSGGSSGGGIYNYIGTLNITNSTFSGNSASDGFGGGIYNESGTATITNSTFSGNTAKIGGGVYSFPTGISLYNTIVANSTSGGNCGGWINNGGNNLEDGTTCNFGTAFGSMSSTVPLLASLADNGGPTQTFALLAGSPAINGVTFNAPNSAPSTDQRGVARPQSVRYDIGSYESVRPYRIYLPLLVFKY